MKFKECVLCVQVKTIVNMVTTVMKKEENLENQVALQLFIMLEKLITTPKTCEYLLLWRCKVLKKLRH